MNSANLYTGLIGAILRGLSGVAAGRMAVYEIFDQLYPHRKLLPAVLSGDHTAIVSEKSELPPSVGRIHDLGPEK